MHPRLPIALALPAAMLLLFRPALCAAPMISEFMASNQNGITDVDGEHSDWIEIRNPDPAAVDLGGYHLTDDAARPMRWTFPDGTILPPGGHLVVFASGKNRVVAGQELHTNFNLSAGGEFLALNAPGGSPSLTAWSPFPPQSADISYGLVPPEFTGSGFFLVATPGALNDASLAQADPVAISVASRTFAQGTSFPVTLSTASADSSIRYTLNRAMPIDENGIAPVVTVSPATDTLTAVAHGLRERDQVQVASSGALPAGLGVGLTYYVKVLGPDTFQLTEDAGGPPIDLTGTGSGVIHVRRHAAIFTASGTTISVAEHRFYADDPVQVANTGGTLPTGLVAGNTYFVRLIAGNRNAIQLATTPGGAAITTSSAGTGTQRVFRTPSPLYTTPLTISYSLRLRARSFQAGRSAGTPVSASYLMMDATAQAFTSNIPIMILHSFGSGHPNPTAPGAGTPEDTKEAVWFIFEPKLEGTAQVARFTNPPDTVALTTFERRGSSTFGATKYSMTLSAFNEFGNNADVSPLGFATNDDFVLNAHYQFDRSLMHNDLIYRLSREAGRWAPNTRHVEVFMSVGNDVAASGSTPAYGVVGGAVSGGAADYYGVYSFQDKIRRGDGLVEVERLTAADNTAPAVQGGYIFKIDRLDAGDSGIAAAGRTFALVQPREWTSYPSHLQVATNAQKAYLAGALNSMYSALTGPAFMNPTTGYAAHLDVPAAIDHWWLSVLPKSADAFRLSGYWHKSRFGRLVMGPIFDFDRAMGSTDGRDLNPLTWRGDNGDLGTDYFHNASIFQPNYFHSLFLDPNYWQATIDRYAELRRTILSTANVHGIIDAWTEMLDPGNGASTPAKRNFLRFPENPPRGVAGTTPGTNGTFRGETAWLKNWWGKAGAVTQNGRFDFVDGQFMKAPVASLPAGPVPVGSSVTITSPDAAIPGVRIFYTTDGTDPRAPATASQALFQQGTFNTLATLIPDNSSVRAIVPTSAATGGPLGTEWRGADLDGNNNNADDFDDSGWFTNAAGSFNGVGYDDDLAISYLPFIGIRWSTAGTPVAPNNSTNTMRNLNGSCYARIAFTLTPADMANLVPGNRLALAMRVDDTFVAWINGTLVANPDSLTPAWNTVWTTSREANLTTPVEYDISAFMNTLHVGTNVLALQGVNGAATSSSDLLLQARLLVQGTGTTRPAFTPSLTSGAIEYTDAITVNGPVTVTARAVHPQLASDPPTAGGGGTGAFPNGSSWGPPVVLHYFPGAAPASQANLRITEVLYHPTSPTPAEIAAGFTNSNDFEFIRLTNAGATPVDLTGIRFADGVAFTAPEGLGNWLPPGASVVVVENLAGFASRFGSTFTVLGRYEGDLNDAGETITLNDRNGNLITSFTYDDAAPWPTAADEGFSLLLTGADPALPGSWAGSVDLGGSGVASFAAWQARWFTPDQIAAQGLSADTDGDGLNNLGEYAFGTDPRTAGTREAAAGVAAPGIPPAIAVRRRVDAQGVQWQFEASTSLGNPTWDVLPVAPEDTTVHGDGTETVTWRAPATGDARRFVRVRVSSP